MVGQGGAIMLSATMDLLNDNMRADACRTYNRPAAMRGKRPIARAVRIQDLSQAGFRVTLTDRLPIGASFRFSIAGAGSAAVRIVRRDGNEHGCAFHVPLATAQVAFAIMAADRTRPAPDASSFAALAKWPRSACIALFVGGGVAAWSAALALL